MNRQLQRLANLPQRIPESIGDMRQPFGHLSQKIHAAMAAAAARSSSFLITAGALKYGTIANGT